MASHCPKILFLAGYFPPLNSVACIRTENIARHLSRRGWEVTVVTPRPEIFKNLEDVEGATQRIAQEGILRILTGHRSRCLEPSLMHCNDRGIGWLPARLWRRYAHYAGTDKWIGWLPEILQACKHLQPGDVDVILATGPPYVAFRAAKSLAAQLRCPYVLDYRDLWAGDPYRKHLADQRMLAQEKEILASSAAVTTISASCAAALEARYPISARVTVITNGFDAADLVDVEPELFDHFAIVYAGSFIPPIRTVTPIMAALQRLAAHSGKPLPEWRFHYYGAQQEYVRAEAERHGLQEKIVLHGSVSRKVALSAVRGAGVAVVVTSVYEQATLEDKGVVTGKLFEIIGLGTPLLLISPPGSDAEQIVQIAGRGQCCTGTDIEGIAAFLHRAMSEPLPAPVAPDAYQWPRLIESFDTLLRQAAGIPERAQSQREVNSWQHQR